MSGAEREAGSDCSKLNSRVGKGLRRRGVRAGVRSGMRGQNRAARQGVCRQVLEMSGVACAAEAAARGADGGLGFSGGG